LIEASQMRRYHKKLVFAEHYLLNLIYLRLKLLVGINHIGHSLATM
jgi:hypothetical protein